MRGVEIQQESFSLTGLFCTSENERESTLQEAIASAPITVRSNFCSGIPMAPARTWVPSA